MTMRPADPETARAPDPTAVMERRSIVVALLVMIPLLVALYQWLNLPAPQRLDLGGLAQAYVDPTGRLELADVLGDPSLFSPATGTAANYGVRKTRQTAFWLRVPLEPVRKLLPPGDSTPLILSLEEPRVRQVDLSVVGADGSVSNLQFSRETGSPFRFPVFALPADTMTSEALYARVVTGSSMRATLYLSPEAQFAASYGRSTIGLALLLGMMAATVAYLVPLGLVLRRAIYLALGAAMMFAALYVASDQALLETYLLPGALLLSRAVSLSASVLFYAAFLCFSVRFLNLNSRIGRIRRAMDGVAAVIALVGIAAFVDGLADTGMLRRVIPYVGMAGICVLGGLLVLGLVHARHRAILFIILWCPLIAAGVLRLQLDTAPSQGASAVALNGIYFGLAVSLLLFAVVTPLELYRRERALHRHAQALLERLESFARIGRDIYIETDRSGRMVYLAGEGTKAFAADDDEHLDASAIQNVPSRARLALSAAALARRPLRNEIFAAEAGETARWYSLRGEPGDGAQNFRAILRDVSTEIEQENERQKVQHLIALGSLAATVAHEINNVVQPIVNMSRGLRGYVGQVQPAGRMLDLIDLASQQAITLVDQILKIGARKAPVSAPDRPIERAVHDGVATLRLILPKTIVLQTQIDPATKTVVPAGDILQILINLVANARRACGDSGTIGVELAQAAGGAMLSVLDHGEGMSASEAASATAPYVSTKAEGRASGIGLAVVKQLVERRGGTVSITSQTGKGTRVDLFFPDTCGDNP